MLSHGHGLSRTATLCLAASFVSASCPGPRPTPEPRPAPPPSEAPAQARVPALQLTAEHTADLLFSLHEREGLVTVQLDERGWRPLGHCFGHFRKGAYVFVPSTEIAAREWTSSSELWRDFGMFADRLGARHPGAAIDVVNRISLRWVQSGVWKASVETLSRGDLSGECGDATHWMRALSVGAGDLRRERTESPLETKWAVQDPSRVASVGDFERCPTETNTACAESALARLRATKTAAESGSGAPGENGAPQAPGDANERTSPPDPPNGAASATAEGAAASLDTPPLGRCAEEPPRGCDLPLWVQLEAIR